MITETILVIRYWIQPDRLKRMKMVPARITLWQITLEIKYNNHDHDSVSGDVL